jgi:signal transduction histidine kinase
MLHEHTDALGDYLTRDPKGRQIPAYLTTLADYLTQEQATILKELEGLSSKIDHIRRIIDRQQDMARVGGVHEPVGPGEIMEEALAINLAALQRHQIEVVREYAEAPQIITDKHQVLQILVNLISNARYAMQAWNGRQHRLTLRTGPAEDREGRVRFQVQDTGIGITPEHLPRLFTQGFTTKKDGHGLGLHSSVLAAQQLEGSLSVHSAGEGQGATFTLDLPARPGEEHR